LRGKLIEDNRRQGRGDGQGAAGVGELDSDQINDIMEGRPPRPPKPTVTEHAPFLTGQCAVARVTATPAREA